MLDRNASIPTVLICDDDAPLVTSLCLFFRRAGFDPIPMTVASQVLEAAVRMRPSLILLDLGLDGPGRGVFEELALNPITCGIPVVMITGHVESDISAARKKVGIRVGLDSMVRLAQHASSRPLALAS